MTNMSLQASFDLSTFADYASDNQRRRTSLEDPAKAEGAAHGQETHA